METGLKRGTLRGRELDHVGHDADGGLGRADPFLLRDELLSMSFCIVPPTRSHPTPCLSATARYMARATDAVQLIVIERRHVGERNVGEQALEVVEASRSTRPPCRPRRARAMIAS